MEEEDFCDLCSYYHNGCKHPEIFSFRGYCAWASVKGVGVRLTRYLVILHDKEFPRHSKSLAEVLSSHL